MFSVFKSALGLAGSLPFTLGEENKAYSARTEWQLFQGGKHSKSGRDVTVFRVEHATKPCLNARQRFKTLRHPNVLQYVDSAEHGEEVHIATEAVVPLVDWLTAETQRVRERFEKGPVEMGQRAANGLQQHCLWGLSQILRALAFLNMDCSMVHGLVCPDSIFVTPDGDWKLGGLDTVCEVDTTGANVHLAALQSNPNLQPQQYKCPELKQTALPRNTPAWAFDMWAFAVLCIEVVFSHDDPDQDAIVAVPKDLQRACKASQDARPSRRPSPRKVLDNASASFAHNPFVKTMTALEHWALKSDEEKEAFMAILAQHVGEFPEEVCLRRLLPLLVREMQMDAASAGANGGGVSKWKIMALSPLAQIAPHVPADQFKAQVEPVILRFFASKNRMTRVMVLQNCPAFVGQLDRTLVNGKIFSDVLSGFADTNKTMREETIKVMVALAPVLNAENLCLMLQQFNRLMNGTKGDASCTFLRENCVICAQHTAGYVHAAGKQLQLLSLVWIPALQDPEPPCRVRAVVALRDAPNLFSAEQVAREILPCLAPLLVDPDADTRTQCSVTLQRLVSAVTDAASRNAASVQPEPLVFSENPDQSSSAAGAGSTSAGVKGKVGSWGRWALSAVSSATSAATSAVKRKVSRQAGPGQDVKQAGASDQISQPRSAREGPGQAATSSSSTRPPQAKQHISTKTGWDDDDDDGDFSDFSDADDGGLVQQQKDASTGASATNDPFSNFFSQNSQGNGTSAKHAPSATPNDLFFEEFGAKPAVRVTQQDTQQQKLISSDNELAATIFAQNNGGADAERAKRKEEQRKRAAERKARAAQRRSQQGSSSSLASASPSSSKPTTGSKPDADVLGIGLSPKLGGARAGGMSLAKPAVVAKAPRPSKGSSASPTGLGVPDASNFAKTASSSTNDFDDFFNDENWS